MIAVLLQNEAYALLTAVLAIVLLIATRLFGYSEFLLIKRRLTSAMAAWAFRGRRTITARCRSAFTEELIGKSFGLNWWKREPIMN